MAAGTDLVLGTQVKTTRKLYLRACMLRCPAPWDLDKQGRGATDVRWRETDVAARRRDEKLRTAVATPLLNERATTLSALIVQRVRATTLCA